MTTLSVLHVTPYLAPAWAHGHVPAAVWELAKTQVSRGVDVSVLTTDAMAPHERLPAGTSRVEGVRVVRVRNAVGLITEWLQVSTPTGWRRAARGLLAGRPLIVHLHELRSLEARLVAPLVPREALLIASTHGCEATVDARTMRARVQERLLRHAWQRIDHVIADSPTELAAVSRLAERTCLRWSPATVSLTANETASDPSLIGCYERLLMHTPR